MMKRNRSSFISHQPWCCRPFQIKAFVIIAPARHYSMLPLSPCCRPLSTQPSRRLYFFFFDTNILAIESAGLDRDWHWQHRTLRQRQVRIDIAFDFWLSCYLFLSFFSIPIDTISRVILLLDRFGTRDVRGRSLYGLADIFCCITVFFKRKRKRIE